jgi:CRISPR system Cascade subunit CasE
MYLSRIKLNTTLRKTMQALAAPNLFHGAVESSEPDGRTRKLWRTDTLRGEQYLLVLSEKELDLSGAAEQFGYGEYETKPYDGLMERITPGSRWQFRLRANPTIQKSRTDGRRSKVLAHITTAHQEEWLRRQAERNGFSLADGEWLVTGSKWYIFRKNKTQKQSVRMLGVTFEGVLTVTDAEKFRNALICGIGREKAFGMGLLTIAGAGK